MMKGFTIHNIPERPLEDFYLIDKNKRVISVADGVTRDWDETLRKDMISQYPNPSPAEISAKLFCIEFQSYLSNKEQVSEREIRNAFEKANKKIGEWNRLNNPNPDYALKDLAGCVASGIVESEDIVYYGFLTDCGVAVFDKNGDLRFRTENQGPSKFDEYIWRDERLQNQQWTNPEVRRIIRRDYRNNPKENHSFGVLTGEESALNYVRTGSIKLQNGDYVLVYSDGVENIIFDDKGKPNNYFKELLRKDDFEGLERLCKQKVKTEGTLVILKK